jgi:predicted ATPase
LSIEFVQEIAERADGVPLFIEELTRVVLESGPQAAAALSAAPHPMLSIPATLHASLMARLDRLGRTAKELAQKGAVIGREFSYNMVASIADLPEPQLCEALERLTTSGLLFVRAIAPQSIYTFKHALVQDAAYGTLLRGQRQQLHAGIAATLERRFPEIVTAQAELLAHHYTEAGLAEPAVQHWCHAGKRATGRSANLEAIAHLTRGLEVLNTVPESHQRDEQELMLQVALVAPHWASKGWAPREPSAPRRGLWSSAGRSAQTRQSTSGHYGRWPHSILFVERYGSGGRWWSSACNWLSAFRIESSLDTVIS